MEILRKFDLKVFIVLLVLTVGIDYFNDPTFGQKDIIFGAAASTIGALVWGVFKNRLGF
jgi:hypothetical protein